MIEKLISSSRTTEVDAVSFRFIGAYENTTISDEFLDITFESLAGKSQELTLAIRRSKTESELEIKDEVRDAKLRAIHYLLLGLLHHPSLEVKAAAEEVEQVFDNYGLSIVNESYASESSLISSLLADLAKPDLLAAITVLTGCAEIIAALAEAQGDFEETRIAYETEKAKEGILENATAIKKEVVTIVNEKLVVYLRAMLQANGGVYGDFARTIAQMINDNNEVVKKRRKKPEPEPTE